jgi:phospholipase/carboxylesterase
MGLSPANPRAATGTVVVGEPLESASVAVVVVHGRDQDPRWMLENLVWQLELPRAAYILPSAEGGSWYPNRFFDPAEHNEPWLGSALAHIGAAVALAEDGGVPVRRVVLAGFSQGACLVAPASSPRCSSASPVATRAPRS